MAVKQGNASDGPYIPCMEFHLVHYVGASWILADTATKQSIQAHILQTVLKMSFK